MDQTGKDPIISAPSETSLWTKVAVMTASIAAIGAVFGAFYLGTVFSNAPRETKSVATAETTGSAPAQDNPRKEDAQATASAAAPAETSDTANCREQTWPYIARPCLAKETGARGVRVISTDKLADPAISAVETPPDTVINRNIAPPEPQKAQAAAPASAVANNSASTDVTPLKSGAALGTVAISPAAAPPVQTPEPVAAVATPPTEPPVAQPVATPATPPPAVQATAAVEPLAVTDKRSEKSKRKAAKRQDDRFKDSERSKTVTAQSDDDDDAPVAEKSSGRIKGRVVERWTERDYNVPSHDGSGTRRVIVNSRDDAYRERSFSTERGSGFPNIFGAIFGN